MAPSVGEYTDIPDGMSAIEVDLPTLVAMIARTARWVHPDTFRALPIWCPDTARGRPRYDAKFQRQLISAKGVPKVEENIRAGEALVRALGARTNPKPAGWTVCHIWGYDDDRFAEQSGVVKDPLYYSCVANMVWLPTPLKGFTDASAAIKEMLRTCAYHLYGWTCDHSTVVAQAARIRTGVIPQGYPESWPTGNRRILPPGTADFTPRVAANVASAKAKIKARLADPALTNYHHDDVRRVLATWRIDL